MTDFGLPTAMYRFAENKNQLVVAANELGYPLVMKTAESGIHHKSDCDGVILSISNQETLESSYRNLINRLGRRVLLMPMITGDVEISVGMKNDPQYGPLVIVAGGGILIELIDDRAFALAPVNHQQANELLSRLKVSTLLNGFRGKPAVDRQALVDLIVKFSEIAFSLSDVIQEIDLNPVMVNQHGCTIVDALVISKR